MLSLALGLASLLSPLSVEHKSMRLKDLCTT